jgi:hypothetical protein
MFHKSYQTGMLEKFSSIPVCRIIFLQHEGELTNGLLGKGLEAH